MKPLFRWFAISTIVLSALIAQPSLDAHAQESSVRIESIEVRGNHRVEAAAILRQMKIESGSLLDPQEIGEDIRQIYELGFFEDIVVSIKDGPRGPILIVTVQEKPIIRNIVLDGNKKIKETDLKEKYKIQELQILNESDVRTTVGAIKDLYQEKGFYLSEVDYELNEISETEVDVIFHIDEYQRVQIGAVTFIGNNEISSKELQKIIESRPKGFLSFLSKSGRFNASTFATDLQRLRAYYYEFGFLDVEVHEPLVELSSDRKQIFLSIPITEGPSYDLASVDVGGEIEGHEDVVEKLVQSTSGDRFKSSAIREDSERIETYFKDLGYAFTQVSPLTDVDEDALTVGIKYQVRRGEIAHIGRIDIVGNTLTRDRVIRRELVIEEGERYSTTKIQASLAYVQRLGFFEDVDLREERSAQDPGLVNLQISVQERPTRTLQVGAGYSSYDGIMANAQISENNLFGRGQQLTFMLNLSKRTRNFEINFMEPRLAGSRWQLNVSLFNRRYDYPQFRRDSLGASLNVGYMLTRELTLTLGWRAERIHASASRDSVFVSAIFNSGNQLSIGPTAGLYYDSRDDRLFPTRGMYHGLRGELSDSIFGAQQNYVKGRAFARFYWEPLWDNWVIRFNAEIARIFSTRSGEATPITERYFLGGPQTVRGFNDFSLSPCETRGRGGDPGGGTVCDEIGGHKSLHFNLELEFPIVQDFGLRGVVFVDAGNAFGLRDNLTLKPDFMVKRSDREAEYRNVLRTSAGFGVRWRSPIGPLRFEWGFPLARLPGENAVRFEFGIGNLF